MLPSLFIQKGLLTCRVHAVARSDRVVRKISWSSIMSGASTSNSSHEDRSREFSSANVPLEENSKKTILVVGSMGCLGKTIVDHFDSVQPQWKVLCMDVIQEGNNSKNCVYAPLEPTASLSHLTGQMATGVLDYLEKQEEKGLDGIICAAGGFAMDPELPPAGSPTTPNDIVQGADAFGQSIEQMMYRNLYPVLASSYVAQQFMNQEGLFVTFGATAALNPTPNILAYGTSKAAVHQVTESIGMRTDMAGLTSGQRKATQQWRIQYPALKTMTALSILPTTIDTPANREAMPTVNWEEEWTQPVDIAKQLAVWLDHPVLRPHSSALVKVRPDSKNKTAIFTLAA